MKRCVVVGMGPIGNRHARAYTESPQAELVGVCDRDITRAKAAGEKFGVPYFLSAKEMFAALKSDICSVATGGFEYSSQRRRGVLGYCNSYCGRTRGKQEVCG